MNQFKRLLFISYPFAGTGANMLRYQSFARYLSENGIETDIIGYYHLKSKLPNGARYYQIKGRLSLPFIWYFIRLFVANLYLLRVQSISQFVNRVALASLSYTMASGLMKMNQYDACFVGIHPWAFYLIIPLLRKHMRTVIDISDPLYKNAINKNSSHSANLRFEKQALESADMILTMNEPTIEIMTGEMGISRNKIEFVTPAMAISSYLRDVVFTYETTKPLRLIYSGSLYRGYRDLNEVAAAIESLQDVVLDIYTGMPSCYETTNTVRYHDWISHEELLLLYKEYDLLLFVDNAYGYQVPSKIFELLAQNKPILFVYDKRNMYFYKLLKGQKGIFFAENTKEDIEKVFLTLLNKQRIEVCYTFDMSNYTEEVINYKMLASLSK